VKQQKALGFIDIEDFEKTEPPKIEQRSGVTQFKLKFSDKKKEIEKGGGSTFNNSVPRFVRRSVPVRSLN
jgi:hypothetical protein